MGYYYNNKKWRFQMKVEEVLELFGNINCCQATLLGLVEDIKLDEKTALKIATGFGGGLGKADVCGVVSGVCMALSMKYGMNDYADCGAKEKTGKILKEFIDKFREENGSHLCRELLGYDKSTEEGARMVKELNLVKSICPNLIKSGIELGKEFL
jgi:C_GCAxxG_C_C family probable redox protein